MCSELHLIAAVADALGAEPRVIRLPAPQRRPSHRRGRKERVASSRRPCRLWLPTPRADAANAGNQAVGDQVPWAIAYYRARRQTGPFRR